MVKKDCQLVSYLGPYWSTLTCLDSIEPHFYLNSESKGSLWNRRVSKGTPLKRGRFNGYPCYRIRYRGPPFEISLCNRSTMSFCQNCGKEIQSEWIRCPFCPTQPSQTKTLGKQISYALGSCILIFSLYVLFTSKYFEDALFWMIAPMGIGSAIILNAMMK